MQCVDKISSQDYNFISTIITVLWTVISSITIICGIIPHRYIQGPLSLFAFHHLQRKSPQAICLCFVHHFTQQWAMFYELISSQLRSEPLPRGTLHPLSDNSSSQDFSPSRLNVVRGCVITEYVMGMQGHLDLQSQVLALQLTASSIIDRGKPIRTICSPQRSARAA